MFAFEVLAYENPDKNCEGFAVCSSLQKTMSMYSVEFHGSGKPLMNLLES